MAILTAIIIDDEPGIAALYSGLVKWQDVKIVGIGYTGIDAIRLVNSQKPDIVFLDINLPELNGVGALKVIKKISPITDVVMMTGDKSADFKKLSQYGATALIFKPIDFLQIMHVFERIKTSGYTSAQT